MLLRGQSSIEYLTMLTAFFTIFIPIVLLFLSQTSIRSEPLKQDQLATAISLLKEKIEDTYRKCPDKSTVFLSFPAFKTKVELKKEAGKPFLLVSNERGSFATPLDIVYEKTEVDGVVEVAGSRVLGVSCEYQEDSIKLSISEEVS